MEEKRCVIEINTKDIPLNHSKIDVYITNRYEYDPDDNKDSYIRAIGDSRKVSQTKHLKDGYENLIYIDGEFERPVHILVHLSETEKSFWKSH